MRKFGMILTDDNFVGAHSASERPPTDLVCMHTQQIESIEAGAGRRTAQLTVLSGAVLAELKHITEHGDLGALGRISASVVKAAFIDAGLALYVSLITPMPCHSSTCMRIENGLTFSKPRLTAARLTPAPSVNAAAPSALAMLCWPR